MQWLKCPTIASERSSSCLRPSAWMITGQASIPTSASMAFIRIALSLQSPKRRLKITGAL